MILQQGHPICFQEQHNVEIEQHKTKQLKTAFDRYIFFKDLVKLMTK